MITPKHAAEKVAPVLSLAAMMLCASTALAQTVTQKCLPPQVIPLTGTEPAAKIVIDPPLAQRLASRSPTVRRTCTLHRCSARVLFPFHRAWATFM